MSHCIVSDIRCRDREPGIGYELSRIEFDENGQPTAASDSRDAAVRIMYNQDVSACPSGCLRPVGLAFDSQGRLFVSSDRIGELWILTQSNGGGSGTST